MLPTSNLCVEFNLNKGGGALMSDHSYVKGPNCSCKQQIYFWFIILMENNFEKISCKYLFCPFEKQPCLDGGFAMIGCDQLCAYASHKQPMCRI